MSATGRSWSLSAVYGPQSVADKLLFIDELKGLKDTVLPEWMLLGDFNLLLKESDKSSRNVNRRLIATFKAAVNTLELSEVRMHGRRFTWTSSSDPQVQSKIDHCFSSVAWSLMFPQSHLQAKTSSMSDHCILMLTGQLRIPVFRGFRFEDYWVKQRGFLGIVEQAWTRAVSPGDWIRTLHIKLCRVAKALRFWSRARLGNIRLLSTIAEHVILGLDVAQEGRDLTIAELALRQFLKQKLLGLAAIARTRIRQRSRVLWAGVANANPKLFHM